MSAPAAAAAGDVHPDDHPPFPELQQNCLAMQAHGWGQLRVRNSAGESISAVASILHAWSDRLRVRGDTERATRLRSVADRIAGDPFGDAWGSVFRHCSDADSAIPAADFQAITRELGVEDVGRPAHAVGAEGEVDPGDYQEEDAFIAGLTPEFFAQQQAGEPVLTPEQRAALFGLAATAQ